MGVGERRLGGLPDVRPADHRIEQKGAASDDAPRRIRDRDRGADPLPAADQSLQGDHQGLAQVDYLSNVNALRGIAALVIVLFHIDLYSHLFSSHLESSLLGRSYLMVDLFFALSGFIMCHVYRTWFEYSIESSQIKRFIYARFARIYPLHFLSLLYLVALMIGRFYADPTAWDPQHSVWYSPMVIPLHLLLLQGMNTTPFLSWNDPSWSISTEWWMYLLFPFLVKPLLKASRLQESLIATACFASYLAIMYLLIPRVTVPDILAREQPDPSALPIDVTYRAVSFAAPRVLFWECSPTKAFSANRWRRWLAGGPSFTVDRRSCVVLTQRLSGSCLGGVLLPIVLSSAYGGKTLNALLGARALQGLGDWSYAMHMIHIPLMQTMFLLMMLA